MIVPLVPIPAIVAVPVSVPAVPVPVAMATRG